MQVESAVPRYVLDLYINEQELSRYYGGAAHQVRARARCGTWVAFPAQWLRPFVGHLGVQGSFAMETDAQHRLLRFTPV